MITVLLVLAVLGALALPRNRLSFYFLLLVIFVTIAGNLDNPDRFHYVENFDGIQFGFQNDSFEPGYQYLVMLGSASGLNYFVFHALLTAAALLLMAKAINEQTDYPAAVLLAYLCFPFFWDVTQVRNFYAMAIIVYGMKYLLVPRTASTSRYVAAILCASLFHITSLFYLLFLLAKLKSRAAFGAVIGLAAFAYTVLFSQLVASPMFAFLAEKIDVYTTTQTSLVTKAAVLAIYGLSLVLLWWAARRIAAAPAAPAAPGGLPPPYLRMDPAMVLKINIVAVLSILLALDNLDFIRLYRNIFVVNAILMINSLVIPMARRRAIGALALTLYLIGVFAGFVYLTSTSNIIETALIHNTISE
jgi:hypothetical protein